MKIDVSTTSPKVVTPPNFYKKHAFNTSVFLAGSIEMGNAEFWQPRVIQAFNGLENLKDLAFFNPRRDDWDSSWEQTIGNPKFNEQVNWEISYLEHCSIIFMYFSPNTKSPISLLEYGRYVGKKPMIIVCPDEFWRSGNVNVLAAIEGVPVYKTLDEGIGALRCFLSKKNIR